MCLVSAEREQDRREVGDQQVLDHVEARHLLAEHVERRDERDEQAREPAAPGRGAPAAGGAGAALARGRAPAQAVDRRRSRPGRSARRGRRSTKCRGTRHTIVTFACCSGARAAARLSCHASIMHALGSSALRLVPRLRAPPAARRWRDGLVCGACLRRLPWLRGHRCPRCALPRHRAGCPAAARRVRPRVGAAGLRGRGARPRARAEVPRRAAGRGPDGRAPGRQPAARPAPAHSPAAAPVRDARRRSPRSAVVPVPAHRGRRRRRGFDPAALLAAGARRARRAAALPLPAAHGPRRGGRSGRAARAPERRAVRGRRRPRRRRAPRCSSTTSTPPARRSTSAPAR